MSNPEPNKVLCPNDKIPIVFMDVRRNNNHTFGIYQCPKCKKEFFI